MGLKPRGRFCVVDRSSRAVAAGAAGAMEPQAEWASCQELPANPAHSLPPLPPLANKPALLRCCPTFYHSPHNHIHPTDNFLSQRTCLVSTVACHALPHASTHTHIHPICLDMRAHAHACFGCLLPPMSTHSPFSHVSPPPTHTQVGRDSFWYQYIKELDRQRARGVQAVESPLLWSDEELADLLQVRRGHGRRF